MLQGTKVVRLTKIFINKHQIQRAMGRIKTKFIKRKTKELLKVHGDKFTDDFTQNKQLTNRYTRTQSKKLRNIIAGYMTRLKKKGQ